MRNCKHWFWVIMIIALFVFSCKSDESKNSWAYKVEPDQYTVFPEELFGINFCKIEFIDIIKELQRKKIDFEYYDKAKDRFVKYTGDDYKIEKTEDLKSNYFIGEGLDKSKIIEVIYADPYKIGGFHFKLKFKEEYYDTLLELLGNILGKQNSNYNSLNYHETSWDADPNHAVSTCISSITISKKRRYEKAEKGICYLEIIMRPRETMLVP